MSAAIQFYHLTASPLERALPKLLEKAVAGQFRVLLWASSEERAERLNQLLWTYNPGSFLPHGSLKDGHAEEQPIFISTELNVPNSAKLLAVTDGRMPEKPNAFERILDIFDGNDAEAVAQARTRWTAYKNGGHEVSYLRQTEQGGWEKAA
ncbi:MAG: DNA polymerase III subunit chi [Pseudomonadota bacterium]|nr:DNA polymerase III subunit chi [Pseudomonadota bacterium]MDE3038740.1 DNA polymerase III subunit chi [Pseudomonadota bacterium]